MRKQKEIVLEVQPADTSTVVKFPVTVFELTAGKVKVLMDQDISNDAQSLRSRFMEFLPFATTLTIDDIIKFDLAPSDIEEVWLAFKEVNSSFFGILNGLGISEAIISALKAEGSKLIQSALGEQYARSLPVATLKPITTDGAGSSKPLRSQKKYGTKK